MTEDIIVTKVIGFDRPQIVGKVYKRRITDDKGKPYLITYKILREASRAEWEAQNYRAKNEMRVSNGRFYEIQPLD